MAASSAQWVFSWIVVGALSACGGGAAGRGATDHGATAGTQVPIDWHADPIRLFPSQCAVVARVDVDQVRRSPHGDVLIGLLNQAVEAPLGSLLAGLAPKTRDVHACFVRDPHQPRALAVLLIRGAYAEDEFESLLPHLGLEDRHHVAPRSWASEVVHAGEIAPGTWILGDDPLYTEVAARAEGTSAGPSPREDATFAAQAAAMRWGQGAAEVIAVRPREGQARSGNERFSERLMSDLLVASGRLDLPGDVRVLLRGQFVDANAAREHVQVLRSIVGQYAQNMVVELLGVAPLLRRIEIRQDETEVQIRGAATEEEIRELLGRFGRVAARMVAGGA